MAKAKASKITLDETRETRASRGSGASTPSSDASHTSKDFYAHVEASSEASSQWDTDSVLGAVLEDLTDETGATGG